jgi:hypothetical protein
MSKELNLLNKYSIKSFLTKINVFIVLIKVIINLESKYLWGGEDPEQRISSQRLN